MATIIYEAWVPAVAGGKQLVLATDTGGTGNGTDRFVVVSARRRGTNGQDLPAGYYEKSGSRGGNTIYRKQPF